MSCSEWHEDLMKVTVLIKEEPQEVPLEEAESYDECKQEPEVLLEECESVLPEDLMKVNAKTTEYHSETSDNDSEDLELHGALSYDGCKQEPEILIQEYVPVFRNRSKRKNVDDSQKPGSSGNDTKPSKKKRSSIKKYKSKEVKRIIEKYSYESDSDFDISLSDGTASSSDEEYKIAVSVDPIIWSDTHVGGRIIDFSGSSGLVSNPGDEPISFFNMVMNSTICDFIVNKTNAFGNTLKSETKTSGQRMASWKPITNEEFRRFLGILFLMGIYKLPHLNMYWSTHRFFDLKAFRDYMSGNRFQNILRALHFSNESAGPDLPTKDRLRKIQGLVDLFNSTMEEIYHPYKELSIDEPLRFRKGRLIFRQYIPDKSHKYGVKLHTLTDSNGVVLKFVVFAGSEAGGRGHPEKVVKQLLEGKLQKGHSVYIDNYYTSVSLVQYLLNNDTNATGTIQMKSHDLPVEIKNKKLKRGEKITKYSDKGLCLIKWKDHQDVLIISTEHSDSMVEMKNRRGQKFATPLPIIEYNKYMLAFEKQDQMMSYYPSERKATRWYKKLGCYILQMLMLNSYILYKKNVKNLGLLPYFMSVLEVLLPEAKRYDPARILSRPHYLIEIGVGDNGKKKRKRCLQCLKINKRIDTFFMCAKCLDNPGFCLRCFPIFHNY